MPRRRAGECSRCITRIAPVQCRGCIPRCRVLFVANPLWRRDFDSLLRTITSGCCAMARVKTRSVIALVLALAAEFVFYSVRHVELAFEILSSNKSLFKRKQTGRGVVVRPTFLDCPAGESGRDGKHRPRFGHTGRGGVHCVLEADRRSARKSVTWSPLGEREPELGAEDSLRPFEIRLRSLRALRRTLCPVCSVGGATLIRVDSHFC